METIIIKNPDDLEKYRVEGGYLLNADAGIECNLTVGGYLAVRGNLAVGGYLDVRGGLFVRGDLDVGGDLTVGGDLDVRGNKLIKPRPLITIGPLGSRHARLWAFNTECGIRYQAGCFRGDTEAFLAAVAERHGDSDVAMGYREAVAFIENYFKM